MYFILGRKEEIRINGDKAQSLTWSQNKEEKKLWSLNTKMPPKFRLYCERYNISFLRQRYIGCVYIQLQYTVTV